MIDIYSLKKVSVVDPEIFISFSMEDLKLIKISPALLSYEGHPTMIKSLVILRYFAQLTKEVTFGYSRTVY